MHMITKYLRIVGDDWDAIREQFTEEEKKKLREAVTSTALCPRLVTIDKEKLPVELTKKLNTLLEALAKK